MKLLNLIKSLFSLGSSGSMFFTFGLGIKDLRNISASFLLAVLVEIFVLLPSTK